MLQGDDRADRLLAEALEIFVDLSDPRAIAETLDVLARTNAERGSVITATRLLAGAAALRERTGVPAPTDRHYRADYDRAVTLVRAVLSADELAAVQTAVQELALEDVVAEAIASVGPSQSPSAESKVPIDRGVDFIG